MQQRAGDGDVGGAEEDGEVEGAGAAGADGRHGGAVVGPAEGHVARGQRDGQVVEGVDLDVGALRRLGVVLQRLDDVGAVDVVGARGADGVVAAVQRDGGVGRAGPGEVAVGADDGEHLGVGVGDGEDDRVVAGGQAAGAGDLGEGESGRGDAEGREESRELHGGSSGGMGCRETGG